MLLVIKQLKQAIQKPFPVVREDQHQDYNSILNYLNWGYQLEKKNFIDSEEQKDLRFCGFDHGKMTASKQDNKKIISICESLMIQFWQTWRAAQLQIYLCRERSFGLLIRVSLKSLASLDLELW